MTNLLDAECSKVKEKLHLDFHISVLIWKIIDWQLLYSAR